MLIHSTLSNRSAKTLTKKQNPSPQIQPRTQEWSVDGDSFSDTKSFVQELPHRLTLANPSKDVLFSYTDNEVKPAISRRKKITNAIGMGVGGTLLGGLAGVMAAGFALAKTGSSGMAPFFYGTVALTSAVGAAMGVSHSLEFDNQAQHINKFVRGTVSASPTGDLSFHPTNSPRTAVSLKQYQSAVPATEGPDGKLEFGQQWWNNLDKQGS